MRREAFQSRLNYDEQLSEPIIDHSDALMVNERSSLEILINSAGAVLTQANLDATKVLFLVG